MIGTKTLRMLSAFSLALLTATNAAADRLKDGRIAIIDVSNSLLEEDDGTPITDPPFDQFKEAGVLVIGRYFSRCPQKHEDGSLWRKRLIDGVSKKVDGEANAIREHGFAIMSIYQFNNRKGKFSGSFYGICGETKYAKELKEAKTNQAKEGILDAEAAINQALAVHQPPKTVIYFGIDYDFEYGNAAEKQGILDYFGELKKQFDKADYRIGAYADGDALRVLAESPFHLMDVAWLVPSPGFSGTYQWDLFQSKTDNKKMMLDGGRCLNLEYDTNIQSAAAQDKDLGFWNKDGLYNVPPERTREIFSQRKFICNARGLQMPAPATSCKSQQAVSACRFIKDNGWSCYDRTVRVDPDQKDGDDVRVDYYDYGKFDTMIEQKRLNTSLADKPDWDRAPESCK